MSGDTVWAKGLARGLLEHELLRRWAHVCGVARQADNAALRLDTDRDILVSSAYLHDIGYAPVLVATGLHSIDGARYLRRIGAPARLTNLVAHHSSAILEAELRGLLPELAEFEDEGPTALRDALWWADMTTTPDGGYTNLVDRVAEIQERYGPDDIVSCFIRWAWPELLGAVERTEERLRAAGVDYEK